MVEWSLFQELLSRAIPNFLSIRRQMCVAFRPARVAFFRSLAERKTTIQDRTMLNPFHRFDRRGIAQAVKSSFVIIFLCRCPTIALD